MSKLVTISDDLKRVESELKEVDNFRMEKYEWDVKQIHPIIRPVWVTQYEGGICSSPGEPFNHHGDAPRELHLVKKVRKIRDKFYVRYPDFDQFEYEVATVLLNALEKEIKKIRETSKSIDPDIHRRWILQQKGEIGRGHCISTNPEVQKILNKFNGLCLGFYDHEYLEASKQLSNIEKSAVGSEVVVHPPKPQYVDPHFIDKIHPWLRENYRCQVSGRENTFTGYGAHNTEIIKILNPFTVIRPSCTNDQYLEATEKLRKLISF